MSKQEFTVSVDELSANITINTVLTQEEQDILMFEIKEIKQIDQTGERHTSAKIALPWSGEDDEALKTIRETEKRIEAKLYSIRTLFKEELIESIICDAVSGELEKLLKRQVAAVDRNEEGLPTYLVIVCAGNPNESIEYEVGTGAVWLSRGAQINGEEPAYIFTKETVKKIDKLADKLFTDERPGAPRTRTLPFNVLETWKEAAGFIVNGKLCHELKEGNGERGEPGGMFVSEKNNFSVRDDEGMLMFLFDSEEFLDGEIGEGNTYTIKTHHQTKPIVVQPLFVRA